MTSTAEEYTDATGALEGIVAMTGAESVLVIPAEALDRAGLSHGFARSGRPIVSLDRARWMSRDLAEGDEAWRQIIPYVIVQVGDRILSYARTPRGAESRLHGFRSIGVGGHVNPSDLPAGLDAVRRSSVDALAGAARREIAEETRGITDPEMRFLGYLRDDDSAVARVHVGFVYRIHTASADLSQEGRMTAPRLLSWKELHAEKAEYEGWSRLIIETEAVP